MPICERAEAPLSERGEALFVLAQCVVEHGNGRGRALELAGQALRSVPADEPGTSRLRAEIEAAIATWSEPS